MKLFSKKCICIDEILLVKLIHGDGITVTAATKQMRSVLHVK